MTDIFFKPQLFITAEWRIYASVNELSLVQILACRLVRAKPLSQPMQEYFQMETQEQVPWILIEIHAFSFTKMHMKLSSEKMAFLLSLHRYVNLPRMKSGDPSQCLIV